MTKKDAYGACTIIGCGKASLPGRSDHGRPRCFSHMPRGDDARPANRE